MTCQPLKAPFPWFGGKSRVSSLVWSRFGAVKNYVEPFFGSGAVLLGRPDWEPGMTETVNDQDSLLCNFWRSVKRLPLTTAYYADAPPIESDLHAKNIQLALRRGDIREFLEGDEEWCDPKLAGWWVWGIGLWIGAEWATLCGPWVIEGGRLVKRSGEGIKRTRPDCSFPRGVHAGTKRQLPDNRDKGVWRKRPELGSWSGKGVHGQGVTRKLPNLSSWSQGVQKRIPHLSSRGQGIHRVSRLESLVDWFSDLRYRFERVRVCCGDWKRVIGPSVTTKHGLTGLFYDSPYPLEDRDPRCYLHDGGVWHEVWPTAIEQGQDPLFRIAVCGYEGEPHGTAFREAGWDEVPWTAQGGYGAGLGGRGDENRYRERIWFSPHCLKPSEQLSLFGGVV